MENSSFYWLLLGLVPLLYLFLIVVMYFMQERMTFFPTQLAEHYPFNEYPDAHEVWLAKTDDHSVHALYFKAPKAKGIVVFFHGNTGALDRWGEAAQGFLAQRMSVLMMDYRGFGKSRGVISTENFKDDALLAYNWARERYDPDRLHLCGRSLGTGIATWLATERVCKTLILETPYTTMQDMAAIRFFWLPLGWFMKYDLDNVNLVERSMAQTFIIHGTQDELIPLRMAKEVAARYGKLFIIQDAGHNDLPSFKAYHDSLHEIFYPYD